MLTVAEYVAKASTESPPRSGFILGIRMCVLAMKLLEIDDPSRYHRKLTVIVETDRCLPDVVQFVLGCRLGNRTLKFKDWGKSAASFRDLTRERAVRVASREFTQNETLGDLGGPFREKTLAESYTALPDRQLFEWQSVIVKLPLEDIPGYHGRRVLCERCGEGIGFRRETHVDGLTLCWACAGQAYWMTRAPI
jgi:formylmethanofuran dehydrogenase subunit E